MRGHLFKACAVDNLRQVDSDSSHKLDLIRSVFGGEIEVDDGLFFEVMFFSFIVDELCSEYEFLLEEDEIVLVFEFGRSTDRLFAVDRVPLDKEVTGEF
jgi:hypothetical protein